MVNNVGVILWCRLHKHVALALIPRHVHVYDERKSHEFANNTEWQPPVRCSEWKVCIFWCFCVNFLCKSIYRFCKFAVSSVTSAKKNGCQILPSWQPPGKSSPSASSVVVHNAQRSSSPKPLGRSKPNFMWVGGTKFCSRHLGHMTKMAATPIYGKNPLKIFSKTGGPIFTKLGM